jgi:hypothetical protein
VADGIFSFDPKPADDESFTLTTLIEALKNAVFGLLFHVETAHRTGTSFGGTINEKTGKRFEFTDIDLTPYDEIWLFGYEGFNDGTQEGIYPLADSELIAIAGFMDGGGGVFATGDHSELGAHMSSRILRVGSMRFWDREHSPPGITGEFGLRLDTLVYNPLLDRSGDLDVPMVDFADQSDNLPQIVTPVDPSHPLVQGNNGSKITSFPDHMHEGKVAVPSDLTRTIEYTLKLPDGRREIHRFEEYPHRGRIRPVPQVIIRGNATDHPTFVEPGDAMVPFLGDDGHSLSGSFDLLCAYDGRAASVGRVVTDSSFHHYIDLNLTGDPLAEKVGRQQGFQVATPDGRLRPDATLLNLITFFRNIGLWLARTDSHFVVINNVVNLDVNWRKLGEGRSASELSPGRLQQYGAMMYRYLANRFGSVMVEDWVASSVSDRDLGDLRRLPFGRSMIAAALGGATVQLMQVRPHELAQPVDRKTILEAGRRGTLAGLRSFASPLSSIGQVVTDVAAKLENLPAE